MTEKIIKVAMMQMRVVAGDIDANLTHAAELIQEAVRQKADIALFPEANDLGWAFTDARKMAHPIPGYVSDFWCELARKNHIMICTGLTEKDGDHLYNAALLIDKEGKILLRHRKINLVHNVEDVVYDIGNCLGTAETEFGTIGVDICADNLYGSLVVGHTLSRMGARIILSPSAWAVPPAFDPKTTVYGNEWRVPYGELTRLYDNYVIGVSNVGLMDYGAWAGWDDIGNSIAFGPGGKEIATLPFGVDAECVQILECPLTPAPASGSSYRPYLKEKGYHGTETEL